MTYKDSCTHIAIGILLPLLCLSSRSNDALGFGVCPGDLTGLSVFPPAEQAQG